VSINISVNLNKEIDNLPNSVHETNSVEDLRAQNQHVSFINWLQGCPSHHNKE